MNVFSNIEKGLKKDLIGKEFVYCSKYGGEIKGKVKGVSLTYQHGADKETNRKLLLRLSKISEKIKTTEEHEIELTPDFRWAGWGFNIMVTSENGISFDLNNDKIYFIDKI